ncbi:MAG: hypothetical protein KDH96_11580 [Candidatus Riesia sp.]|nr:hypothetical protein [Candidatus Riesia sp.]
MSIVNSYDEELGYNFFSDVKPFIEVLLRVPGTPGYSISSISFKSLYDKESVKELNAKVKEFKTQIQKYNHEEDCIYGYKFRKMIIKKYHIDLIYNSMNQCEKNVYIIFDNCIFDKKLITTEDTKKILNFEPKDDIITSIKFESCAINFSAINYKYELYAIEFNQCDITDYALLEKNLSDMKIKDVIMK